MVCQYLEIDGSNFDDIYVQDLGIAIARAIEMTAAINECGKQLEFGDRINCPVDYSGIVMVWYKVFEMILRDIFVPIFTKELSNVELPKIHTGQKKTVENLTYHEFTFGAICHIVTHNRKTLLEHHVELKKPINWFAHSDYNYISKMRHQANYFTISKEEALEFVQEICKDIKYFLIKK